MNFIDFVFFFYIFVGLYFTSLFIFIYLQNKSKLHEVFPAKLVPVSIVMPCYNESEHIGSAIESLLNLDYPKELIEIIVVDDKSKDNSVDIVRNYTKKYSNVKLIINERNSGGAAEPTNIGVRNAKYELIAVTDADSTPDKDALKKMLGLLQSDEKIGGVTCSVLAKAPSTFMQRLQQIEYVIIAFNRRLLDMVDAVYVTPGPFALYRKKVLFEIGLFDTKNMTQDIEIVWRMRKFGYRAKMCLSAKVYSATPKKFWAWWRQRIRWNIGGTQTLIKYKNLVFRNGMLGFFIIPFFSFSLFIGVFGLGIFIYLLFRRIFIHFLATKYSIYAGSSVLVLQDLTFSPSILNFFGAILFLLGLSFTVLGLTVMGERELRNKNIFNVLFYHIVYLAIYPFIMVTGLSKLIRGKYSW